MIARRNLLPAMAVMAKAWWGEGKKKMGIEKRNLDLLVLIVGQACTLRCKHCANFAPYTPAGVKRYDFEVIKKDLATILKSFSVSELQIQGGEPFIYRPLAELLEFLLAYKEIERILVATNGTMTPSPELMEILKNPRIKVRISDYSQEVPSYKVVGLEQKLKAAGVKHEIYEFARNKSVWTDCGGMDTPREVDDSVVKRRFESCDFRGCLTLENSVIGYCSRSTIAPMMQKFKPKSGDYVRVKDTSVFGRDLWKYVSEKKFMESCRVCNGTGGPEITPAEQLRS